MISSATLSFSFREGGKIKTLTDPLFSARTPKDTAAFGAKKGALVVISLFPMCAPRWWFATLFGTLALVALLTNMVLFVWPPSIIMNLPSPWNFITYLGCFVLCMFVALFATMCSASLSKQQGQMEDEEARLLVNAKSAIEHQ